MARSLAGLFVLLWLFAPGARAETLVVGGTGSALQILRQIGALYEQSHPEVKVEVPPSLGSTGGIKAVRAGAIDVAVTGRGVTPGEAGGLRQIVFATTPLAFVSSLEFPPALTTADILAIYIGRMSEWPGAAPIRIVLRPRSESDIEAIAETLPGFLDAYDHALKRPELPVAATDQDNAEAARSLPNSFALMTVAQMIAEHLPLHVIPLDGVIASPETQAGGRYPHAKMLYLVYRGDRADKVSDLVAFLKTPPVEEIFRANGARLIRSGG